MQVLLLCDGGGSIGVGHVTRSLALAEEAVAAGHDVVIAGHFEGAFLLRQLAAAPVEVARLEANVPDAGPDLLLEMVARLRPDVLHVDSYEPQPHKPHGWLMGSIVGSNIEDGAYGRRPADVVIDPTLGAELSTRPDDGSRWLLRGSRYTPVRRRVIDARRRRDAEMVAGEVARSVLVVMGGTDPVGLAPAAVGLLAQTGLALEVTVIAAGESVEQVRAAAASSALSLNVSAPVDDLPALMSRQDLVISAAGTSVWELCCIGVPMGVVWAVDNQREGYHRVVGAGAAIGLGGPELGGGERAVELLRTALRDPRVRADLALAGRAVVDGLGAWRVVRTWEQATRPLPAIVDAGLVVRPAGMSDARLLWQWRNDPLTRAGSRSSAEIPWDGHLRWLTASLAASDRVLLVVEDPAGPVGPVGTVRWDLDPNAAPDGQREWEVSVTVAPDRRGQSLAAPILRAAEDALSQGPLSEVPLSERPLAKGSSGPGVTAYLAVVHVDNRASLRLFETSGYVPDLPPDERGFMRFRKSARVP